VLIDNGSTNGSRINGRQVESPEVVRPGDEIELGSTTLRFELE
jgi:pSer/pThr/pTyr-binding forkhead associated (FHA) protein